MRAAGAKPLPVDLAGAIWVGPAQEFARLWLGRRTTTPLEPAARAGGSGLEGAQA